MSSDVDEYNKMRKHAGAVATLLDQNRSSVEGVADLYRRSTLDYLYGHKEEMDAANRTVLQAARVLRGSCQFLDDDVNKSLRQLSHCLGKYKQMVMDILKREPEEPDAVTLTSGTGSNDALYSGREQMHTSTSERVRETVRKPNKVREQLIKMAQQITEMEVLAVEMLYKDGLKDVDVALLVASSQVPDESDDRRKERLQREKQEQEEQEKRKKKAEDKKRQDEEERLKREEQKRKKQEKERLEQEEKERKQKEKQDKLDEERKRNEEKENELKRQKEEAERLKRENKRRGEEERRKKEAEKKKIAEEKQRAADELKRAEEAEKERLRLEEKRKQEELRDEARRKKAEEDRIRQEEIDRVRAVKKRLEEEERQRELEEFERRRREQELMQEEEERKRKEEEQQKLKEKQSKEEEERLKRDKERQKKAAELKKKREEEALRLKEEEETRRKADQTKWPFIKYELEEEDDKLGSGFASIVRTCPVRVSLRKEQLQCTSVDWRVNRYPIGDHEELVSTMICLRPTDGNELELEDNIDPPEANYRTAWIALPLAVVPRDREAVIRVQLARPPTSSRADRNRDVVGNSEADIVIEPTTEWSDVTTRAAIIEGLDNVCFVETPVKRIDSGGINLVVVTRPKRDDAKWGERGGRVVSPIDPLVSVSAPKNAFQDTASISLQVFIIDAAVIYGLKERYNGCDMLLGASPMVCVNASSQPLKPLTMSVTSPSGGSKKAAKSAAGSKNGDIEGVVNVMIKETSGKWRLRDNIKLEQKPDHVVFDLVDVTRRLILLRTPPAVDSDELCLMATCLETSLNDRPAQLVVRQREDDPSSVYVELCRRDAVDRLVNGERLRSLGYTAGPDPSRLVCLREGDLVEMSFRDNIEPIDKTDDGREIPSEKPVRRFIFNSKITSINAQMFVRERSRFEQNTLQEYRGYVRLCLVERPYAPPPRVAGPYGISDGTVKRTTAAPKAATTQDDHLLCEVAVNLPKKVKEKGYTRINRVNFEIRRNGPLTSEYYDELSAQLGSEWVRLAETLRLTQATIQRIIASHAHLADSSESTRRSARGVLVQWHRDSVSSRGKVEMLIEALKEAGRDDLAASLKAKNNDYRKNFDQKKEEERLKKAIRIFTDSVLAVRAWREIGRELGLTADELEAIGGPAAEIKQFPASKTKNVLAGNSAEMQQNAEKMLNKWIKMTGDEATTSELVEVLKYLKLNDIAEKLMVIQ